MRPLWLDYQRPPPGRRAPGLAVLTVGLLVAGAISADYFAVAEELERTQTEVFRLREAPAQAQAGQGARAAAAPAADVGAQPHTAAEWEALFSSLEAASDESVTLLALHPGVGEIQITGEAKDYAASVDYVQRLQSATGLSHAQMTQSEVVAEHPQRPVRFTLVAQWPRQQGTPQQGASR